MDNRIPTVIHPLIEQYMRSVEQGLPGFVQAFILVGSIALGEFHPGLSDVDFVAVLNRNPSPDDIETLHHIHLAIEKAYPSWKMEGMYFQPEDIGRPERAVPLYLNYHDSRLWTREVAHLNLITWWVLKNHGIAVTGPDPHELPYTIEWGELVRQMRENINTYWTEWTRKPGQMVKLLFNYSVQWAVLGVLRQYYSFRESSITTKIKAGEYGLSCLPERFHPIIREAITLRKSALESSTYRSRLIRAIDAVWMLKYVIQESNKIK